MPDPSAGPRSLWPRREDVFAAGVVVSFVVSTALIAAVFLIETQFRPEDSVLGLPTQIPLCGRSFTREAGNTRLFTTSGIDAGMTAGYAPVIVEPTIGKIPLLALFVPQPIPAGMTTCDVLIFLHVGPGAYVGYGLEGGP